MTLRPGLASQWVQVQPSSEIMQKKKKKKNIRTGVCGHCRHGCVLEYDRSKVP